MRARSMLATLAAACLMVGPSLVAADLAALIEEDATALEVVPAPPPPAIQAAPLPDNVQLESITDEEVRATSEGEVDRVLRLIVQRSHDESIDAHIQDYSRRNDRTGSPLDPRVDGPCYTSRSLAMVHVAMYDAFVGISRDAGLYLPYPNLPDIDEDLRWVAIYAAVERAAMIVTQLEFTGSRPTFSNNAVSPAVKAGWAWGDEVAEAVIEDRTGDGSEAGPVFTPVPPPRRFRDHRRDPTVPTQQNYAAHWGGVQAFAFRNIGKGFKRLPSVRKAGYFNGDIDEVRELGARESTEREADELETGIFWAYDGAFGIGTPPRLYNDALSAIIEASGRRIPNAFRLCRLYAVVNVAMADAAIAAWREKYRVNFWRPTVGIRNERRRFMPDPHWLPYGVPKTNSDLVDATRNPSFPAYPSGHATIGTAAFTAAKIELGVGDDFAFRFTSAEFDGEAKPACLQCGPRPEVTRSLTIGEAIQQNQDSRVFLGVHWSIDSEQGGVLGVTIGKRASQSFPNRF